MQVSTSKSRTRNLMSALVVLLVLGTVLAVLRTYAPQEHSFYPKCMLHQWTGLHCPGCGGTRACAALVHGQLWQAIRFNPLLILGGPLIMIGIWIQRRREEAGGPGVPRLIWTLFFVLVVYSIARNLPSPSRSWLAPPDSVSVDRLPTNSPAVSPSSTTARLEIESLAAGLTLCR